MPRKDPLLDTGTKVTPQSEQADPRQKKNNAGGWTFKVGDDVLVQRFLTLGTTGGTFHVGEKKLTKDATDVVKRIAAENATSLAEAAREISVAGRAPRNDPALYAAAAASVLGDDAGRKRALEILPEVARIGTHLYTWAEYRELFGGWTRGSRRAVSNWYLDKDPEKLAYQLIKYRQRNGWTHRDLLRLAHPKTSDPAYEHLFDWLCGRAVRNKDLPDWVVAFRKGQKIQRSTGSPAAKYVSLIEKYPGLPWEALPDEALTRADVWRALIDARMPMTALIRQLPTLTRLGVLAPMSEHLKKVCDQVGDQDELIKARVHPISLLIAMKTYAAGHSMRGSSTWTPVPQVIDALNDAFYLAFKAVTPSGKRTMLALDVSASMTWHDISGIKGLTPREASAALALVTAATEENHLITAFASDNGRGEGITGVKISPKQRLDDAVRTVAGMYAGGTDCSLPMRWALKNNIMVDTFQVYTDNETWAGPAHAHQALRDYRNATGINARLAVVGMTATDCGIADPADPGSMDVAGFDSNVPAMLADFSRGDL